MPETISPVQLRVLGSLTEKAMTTPDYYPMTLNGLLAACNQKSNRYPVTRYDEVELEEAVESLREGHWVLRVDAAGSRTAKYRHRLEERLLLDRPALAILTVLMLRGPQTVGELRGRTERMHTFSQLTEVEDILRELEERDEPLVERLPREPGRREIRYRQTLGDDGSKSDSAIQVSNPSANCGEEGDHPDPKGQESLAPVPFSGQEWRQRVGQLSELCGELRRELARQDEALRELRNQVQRIEREIRSGPEV